MTQTPAVGDGPVGFFTADGQQISIPLSGIYFEDDTVKTRSAVTPSNPAGLDSWLAYLVAQGRLSPSAAPPIADAMILTAPVAGSNGNSISVTVTPNGAAAVDVTVTALDVYPGLTVDDLEAVLGRSGATQLGSQPGLVRFVPPPAPGPGPAPAALDPAAVPPGAPVTTVTADIPSWAIPASTGATPSFTLAARSPGSLAVGTELSGVWTIEVRDIRHPVTGPTTFTLAVTWTKTVLGVRLADLNNTLTGLPALLAFGVTITPPPPPGGYKLPVAGTVGLGGGAALVPATPATATLVAGG